MNRTLRRPASARRSAIAPPSALTVIVPIGVLVLALGALALAGCGPGSRGVPKNLVMQDVGAYRMGIATTPDPPRVGENVMTLVIRGRDGGPLHGARADVLVSMPAMGAMPYMESLARVREESPGTYRAEYGLAMAGDWDVSVRLAPQGGERAEAAWRVSTNTKGVAFVSGTARAGSSGPPGAARDTGGPAGSAADTAAAAGGMPGTVQLDDARRQALGIRVEPVAERDLSVDIRAAGRVAYDETRLSEVTLKYSGYVREVAADFVGRPVRAGETLFNAYSPDLWSAQQEYLEALRAIPTDSARAGGAREMVDAARRRLELWDLTPGEIDRIARDGKPRESLPIVATVSGVITEKNVVRGSPFSAGQVLYRIARTDPVWVLAAVYQADLPFVRVGLAARIDNPYLDEASRHGRVAFVSPDLAADTRTATARVEVPNPRGALKPGMYVDVEVNVPLGRRLAVPESAVLPTGDQRLVFVDVGGGRLAPRALRLGARAGSWYEVLSGLERGERVVTSGNFLVASESRLRSASGQ